MRGVPWAHPHRGKVPLLAGGWLWAGETQMLGPSVAPFPPSSPTGGRNDLERAGSKVKSIFNQRSKILDIPQCAARGLQHPFGERPLNHHSPYPHFTWEN